MAAFPLKVRGLNVVFVVFSLLVLGGAAAIMEQNLPANIKIGASNVVQSAEGKLVKKGTSAFAACKTVTTTYALIDAQPACIPLSVHASLADPLVGKLVIASGTLQKGIFYATTLKLASTATSPPNPKATCLPRPKCLDSTPRCLPPEQIGKYCPVTR